MKTCIALEKIGLLRKFTAFLKENLLKVASLHCAVFFVFFCRALVTKVRKRSIGTAFDDS